MSYSCIIHRTGLTHRAFNNCWKLGLVLLLLSELIVRPSLPGASGIYLVIFFFMYTKMNTLISYYQSASVRLKSGNAASVTRTSPVFAPGVAGRSPASLPASGRLGHFWSRASGLASRLALGQCRHGPVTCRLRFPG